MRLLDPSARWQREHARRERQERKHERRREKERARREELERKEREARLERQRTESSRRRDNAARNPRDPSTPVSGASTRTRPQETYDQVLNRIRNVQVKDLNARMQRGPQSDYILYAPAVLDSSIPATAAYLEACAEALAHFHGVPNMDDPAPQHVVESANLVEKRWDEAVEFARRNVDNPLTTSQRRRVVQLADMVAHGGRENPEVQLAHERLVEILSSVSYNVPQVGGGTRKVTLNPYTLLSTEHLDDVAALTGRAQKQIGR